MVQSLTQKIGGGRSLANKTSVAVQNERTSACEIEKIVVMRRQKKQSSAGGEFQASDPVENA